MYLILYKLSYYFFKLVETCTKFNLDLPRPEAAQEETIYDFYVTEKGFILYKF
jgi:hypothetical protein